MVLIEAWLPSDLRSWLTPAFILRSYLRPSTVLTPRSAKRAEDSSMLEWRRRRCGSEAAAGGATLRAFCRCPSVRNFVCFVLIAGTPRRDDKTHHRELLRRRAVLTPPRCAGRKRECARRAPPVRSGRSGPNTRQPRHGL
eukprot:scaffold33623_cov59-Phaeocystis_antarctica.AAC.4